METPIPGRPHSLLYLAGTRMYRTPQLAQTLLPQCVEANVEVGRARILCRNTALHTEFQRSILELWVVVIPLAFKHATLMKTRQLEQDWKGTLYEIDPGALSCIYHSILNSSGNVWIYFGRVFAVKTRDCKNDSAIIAIDKAPFFSSDAYPENPHRVYIY